MQHKTFSVNSLDDWQSVIKHLRPQLQENNLFLLDGEVGAGKTTFVSLVAKSLGISWVSSPTFSLIQNYGKIIHVDLYRLESIDEIEATGFWEIFEDPGSLIFVEWPSKVPSDFWPLNWKITRINISKKSDNQREVSIQY